MDQEFNCPVCASRDWKTIETYYFHNSDRFVLTKLRLKRVIGILWQRLVVARPRKMIIHCHYLTSYQKKRRQVLFDVWFPDRQDLIMVSVYCSSCGFTTITPRPDENDIKAKYHYLRSLDPEIGGQSGQDDYARNLDNKRAERIFCLTAQLLSGSVKLKILDYGGGNGKLLLPFLAEGHECYLVDYSEHQLPGIIKIGNDLDDIADITDFDLILCSHVLEHVADVSRLVTALREKLNVNGLFYVEVPQQIWAGILLEADPVTHINFFTRNSFLHLLRANGFDILRTDEALSNYGKNLLQVNWAIVRRGSGQECLDLHNDIGKYLYPGRIESLKKFLNISVAPCFKGKLGNYICGR